MGALIIVGTKNKSGLDCRGVVWYVWYYKDLSLCDVLRFTLLMVSWTNLCSEHWPKHFLALKKHPDPYWLVVSNMNFIFHFIYGMSSFPLTNSYFSEGVQPPSSLCCIPSYYPMSPWLRAPLIKSVCLWKIHCKIKMNHPWSSLSIINSH